MKNITLTFRLEGMDCRKCKQIVESELRDLSYVQSVTADIEKKLLRVTGDFQNIPLKALAKDFSTFLAEYKFTVHPL